MIYTVKGKTYPVVIIRDGYLRVPAQYAGREGRYDVWLGVDGVVYFF